MARPSFFYSSTNFDIVTIKRLRSVQDLGTSLWPFRAIVMFKRCSANPFRSFLITSTAMPTDPFAITIFFLLKSKLFWKILDSSECLAVIFVWPVRGWFLFDSIRAYWWPLVISKLLIVTKRKEPWVMSWLKVILYIPLHVGNFAATMIKNLVFGHQVVLERANIIIFVNSRLLRVLILNGFRWPVSFVFKHLLSITLVGFFNRIKGLVLN